MERKCSFRYYCILFGLFVFTFACVTLYPQTFFYNINYNRFRFSNSIDNVVNSSIAEKKYILLWTTFFGESDYLPNPNRSLGCEFTNCLVTSDKSLYNESKIVIFHWADIPGNLPKYRFPDQNWVLFNLESPHNTPSFSQYDKVMNLTATYRMDSDFFTPYESFRKMTAEEQEILRSKTKGKIDYTLSKTKLISWFVSNCETNGNRKGYVNELNRYIQVDIYGSCGTHSCLPKMSSDCYATISKQYRFYLAFENSICRDYVTEKYFHALNTTMIPVVFGGANYSQIGPPGAFIDARQYPNPKDLANYLLEVASIPELYNSYFEWKKKFVLKGKHWVCDMCKTLNEPIKKRSFNLNLKKWWEEDSHCLRWENNEFRKTEVHL